MKRFSKEQLIFILFAAISVISKAENHRFLGPEHLTSSLVTSSVQDSGGYVWIGTEHGLNRFDGNDIVEYYSDESDEKSLLDNNIRDLYIDREGRMWVGMSGGLQVYDHVTDSFRNVRFEETESLPDILQIIQIDSGLIWAAVSGQGIFETDPETMTARPQEQIRNLCRSRRINNIHVDTDRRIWIGTDGDGIFCLNSKCDKIKEYRLTQASSETIDRISENRYGKIIVAGEGRIWELDEGDDTFRQLESPEGITLEIKDILIRKNGEMIAASGNDGIWKIDRKVERLKGISQPKANIACLMEDRENNIWYGYYNGGIDIESSESSGTIPYERDITLTDLLIDDERVCIADFMDDKGRIRLDRRQNTFTVAMSTMTILDSHKFRFRYRLKGLEHEWYMLKAGQNKITYNHIPPGRYTLEVCTIEDSTVSERWEQKIIIGKLWHSKTVMRSILGSIILIVSGLSFVYVARMRTKESEKRRMHYYATMANQIRTPMVMIINPIDRLLKIETDRDTIHILKTIRHNTLRLLRLTNNFLDAKKLSKGDIEVNIRECDLVRIIRDTLDSFAWEAQRRNITIDFRHPFENMAFRADSEIIDAIIFEFVTSSMKNSPDGSEINVRLAMGKEYGTAEIQVMDNGYNRNGRNMIRHDFCQALAKLHDGNVMVENRGDIDGHIFTLKIKAAQLEMPETEISKKEHTNDGSGKKVRVKSSERILIIENDDDTLDYLRENLSAAYKLIPIRNGSTGIQTALTEVPDLIISEIFLPDINGLQIVKRIKNNPNTTHIPIILLGSQTDAREEIEGLEYGADDYMAKPFNMEILESRISNLLKNRQRVKGKYSGAHQEDRIKTIEVTSNSDKLMMRVMDVINANLDNPELNVEMLSSEVGLSRAQLHRKMKEMTGISTGEFIRNIRLKKAAELLVEKKVNISQVAYIVGFSSQPHFSTAFRKFYGVSPTEYIKNK